HLAMIQPHRHFGFRQRHTKRRAINDDFMRLNSRCARDAGFGSLACFEIVMEAADDFLAFLLPKLYRENLARTIELARFEAFQQMRNCWISRIQLSQGPDERLILERPQRLGREALAEGQLYRL